MKSEKNTPLSFKVNRILNGMFILIFLIIIRVWYLAIHQHEEKIALAEKPQKRVSVIKADRATIYDRFGIPLATNKVQYNASVCYRDICEIPKFKWIVDKQGKKIKQSRRKEYITELSQLVAKELSLNAERIEDLIHAKASMIGKIPLLIKENISESEYFRIKMLEKDYPGLHAEQVAKRCYPCGKVGGEVIGYLGPISRSEYDAITTQMRFLQNFLIKWEGGEEGLSLPEGFETIEDVKGRLKDIEEKTYTINDLVGKAGVEKSLEEHLRGFSGKKNYLSDFKGNYLRELPGSIEARSGNRLYLTISKELQEYAEQLLAEYEEIALNRDFFPENGLWVKGGAIVALDPNTAEVLALASYPRFDPNDFIRSKDAEENLQKNAQVQRWLEQESYIATLWDGKSPLMRERFDLQKGCFFEEELELTWDNYIGLILPSHSPVKKVITKTKTIKEAIFVQNKVNELLSVFETMDFDLSAAKIFDIVYEEGKTAMTLQEKDFLQSRFQEKKEEIEKIKGSLSPYFFPLTLNCDKILFVDLIRLAVDANLFSKDLLALMGDESLLEYRALSSKLAPVQEELRNIVKNIFHDQDFKNWKIDNFKDYLKLKREEEEKNKKYARPYIEYLDEVENALFNQFFETHRIPLLAIFLKGEKVAVRKDLLPYAQAILKQRALSFNALSQNSHLLQMKEIIDGISPHLLFSYLKTLRTYDQLNRPLLGKYPHLRDSSGKQYEKHLAAGFYPKYGYGIMRSSAYRQSRTIGSLFKLVPAYEAMRQKLSEEKYVSDPNPLTIIDNKHKSAGKGEWNVGFTMDNKPIPLIYRGGRLPRSSHAGVGVVDVVRAIETSSNPYFALLAGDVIHDPEDLLQAASLFSYGDKTGIDLPGESPGFLPRDIIYNRSGLYAMSIGQHSLKGTPLQTSLMLGAIANGGKIFKPKILYAEVKETGFERIQTELKRNLLIPTAIRTTLLKGMKQVVQGDNGTARGLKQEFPKALLDQIVGKTSTAETVERISLDGKEGSIMYKNIWFGAIYFDPKSKEEFQKPEIVVVVFLKFGEYGNKAAPFAVKMIQKYLELKEKKSLYHSQKIKT